MRASILIVIFDFLVASLLLFVVAPEPAHKRMRVVERGGALEASPASEFSPQAVAEMETQWRAEADVMWQAHKLREQQQHNTQLVSTVRILEQSNSVHDSELRARDARILALDTAIQQTKQRMEEQRLQLANKENENKVLLAETQDKSSKINQLSAAMAAKEAERLRIDEERHKLDQALSEAKLDLSKLHQRRSDLEAELSNVSASREDLKEQRAQLQIQIQKSSELAAKQQELITQLGKNLPQVEQKLNNIDREIRISRESLGRDLSKIGTNVMVVSRGIESTDATLRQGLPILEKGITDLGQEMRQGTDTINAGIGLLNTNVVLVAQKVEATHESVREVQSEVTKLQQESTAHRQESSNYMAQIAQQISLLPTNFQSTVAALNESQRRIDGSAANISTAMVQLEATLNSEEMNQTIERLSALMASERELQSNMLQVAREAAEKLNPAAVDAIRKQQGEAQEKVAQLGAHIEAINARQAGPYKPVSQARLEVSVSMREADLGPTSWADSDDSWSGRVVPPMFFSSSGKFVAVYYANIGLDWSEMIKDGDLNSISLTVGRPPGDNRWSGRFRGNLIALEEDVRVILIPVTDKRSDTQLPLKLCGRERARNMGTKDFRLFKASTQGTSFLVDAGPDLSDSRYMILPTKFKADSWIRPVESRPECGDFLVTPEGLLVGLMVDETHCFVLDESCLERRALQFPIDSPLRYRNAARNLAKRLEL